MRHVESIIIYNFWNHMCLRLEMYAAVVEVAYDNQHKIKKAQYKKKEDNNVKVHFY